MIQNQKRGVGLVTLLFVLACGHHRDKSDQGLDIAGMLDDRHYTWSFALDKIHRHDQPVCLHLTALTDSWLWEWPLWRRLLQLGLGRGVGGGAH